MAIQDQFLHVSEQVDTFIGDYNKERDKDGGLSLQKQTLKIVGQFALLLADLPFTIAATSDLDFVGDISHAVREKLSELLIELNIYLETDNKLIWMPEDTLYNICYQGQWLDVLIANPRDVLRAKCKFNRAKDKQTIAALENYFDAKK